MLTFSDIPSDIPGGFGTEESFSMLVTETNTAYTKAIEVENGLSTEEWSDVPYSPEIWAIMSGVTGTSP
jgi:hypothetical protein